MSKQTFIHLSILSFLFVIEMLLVMGQNVAGDDESGFTQQEKIVFDNDLLRRAAPGLVLFLVSAVVIFWNELRTVQYQKLLHKASTEIKEIGSSEADPDVNNKLVYVNGPIRNTDFLCDTEFNVSPTDLSIIKLKRKVEVFQWVKNKLQVFERKFDSKIRHYDAPHDHNFGEGYPHLKNAEWISAGLEIGDAPFELTHRFAEATLEQLEERIANKDDEEYILKEDLLLEPKYISYNGKKLTIDKNAIYISSNPDKQPDPKHPDFGDIKVSYTVIRHPLDTPVGVLGKQAMLGHRFLIDVYDDPSYGSIAAISAVITKGAQKHKLLKKCAGLKKVKWYDEWGARAVAYVIMLIGVFVSVNLIKEIVRNYPSIFPALNRLAAHGVYRMSIGLSFALCCTLGGLPYIFFDARRLPALMAFGYLMMWILGTRSSEVE